MSSNPLPIGAGLFMVFLLLMAIFFLLFSRISVKRIEREMAKQGKELCAWDTSGLKIMFCANAICFRGTFLDNENDPMIDRVSVNDAATGLDRLLAIGSFFCALCLGITIIIGIIYPEFISG